MKARVKATGEIVEVKVYKRELRLYIRIHGEKTGEIYRAKDLHFIRQHIENSTLEITYRDSIAIDSTVVYKVR